MEGTMSLLRTYIDPVSTNQILANLSAAIDEVSLTNTLDSMTNRIEQIEAASGPTQRSRLLRKEITILEVQINYIRDRAAFS